MNQGHAMTFSRLLLPVLLLMAAGSAAFAQHNVLLIIADDLGTDYLGFYWNAVDTANIPTIRGLVDRGIYFTNVWSAPTCSPTRAGILTGRHSFRTGVGTALSGPEYPELDTLEITIPELLRAGAPVGYATACIGKWHLNQRTPDHLNYPAKFGYDFYAGNFLGELSDYYNWNKITNGVSSTSTTYATTEAVNDAIGWLGTVPAQKPFFLWLAFNAPHTPLHAPPASLHTVPGLTGAQGHINQNPKLYFKAMIEAMDTETGRLLRWMDSTGRLANTDVIFIGDNGNTRRVSQIADTSHAKGTLYEYGINVPMVIAGPSVVHPGRSTNALVSTVDLFATILEMCGLAGWRDSIASSVAVDSRSFMPVQADQTMTVRRWVYTEQFKPTPDADDGRTIRGDEYKLIRFDDGREKLFRVTADHNETNDLFAPGNQVPPDVQREYYRLCDTMNALLGLDLCTTTFSVGPEGATGPLAVYPNPSAARFALNGLGDAAEVAYRLVAMDGTAVQEGTLAVREGTAHLETIAPAGRYLLVVRPSTGEGRCVMVSVER